MIVVAALYHFTRFEAPETLRAPMLACCARGGVTGSLLLAREGINGTIAADRAGIDAVLAHLRALPGCAGLEWKESTAERPPFRKMKVRLKAEIVTMGQPGVDPLAGTGRYVTPAEWNALIAAPDVAVIDTRNAYEVAIGTFEGAVDPGTARFRDFPAWWAAERDRFAGKRIAMFCTGGIRCEKASNFLLGQGAGEVFHLKGGILKYLEDVPEAQSLWRGECFVFDRRVSVGHGLQQGRMMACGACGRAVSPEGREDARFEAGVSCPACAGEYDDADRARFRERQHQMELAARRGERHLSGPD